MALWQIGLLLASGLFCAFGIFITFGFHTCLARCLTLPLRAFMIARSGVASYGYARRCLHLMDLLESGRMNETEFARRGNQITEFYPEDWQRNRKRFRADQ